MKYTDIQKLCRPVVISMILFFGLLVLSGCVPALPRHRTFPADATNYAKVMASAKINQTKCQELQLGSPMQSSYQDSKLHAVCCWWEVQSSYSASMAFGWKEGGRDWVNEPGQHLLMIEFDEADRLKRFEFKDVRDWEEREQVFSQWVQQSKRESK